MRPCKDCNRFRPGLPFDIKVDCRFCWLAANDPRYETWKPAKPAPAFTVVTTHTTPPPAGPPRTTPCANLGELIRTEVCQFCKKRHKTTGVHACAIWGTCSVKPYRAGQPEQSCKGCQQYEATMPATEPPVIPPGFPPPPTDLTPLPVGRVFNGAEWRALPREHKDYYRALRRAKESGEMPLAPQAPVAYAMPTDKTPFKSPDGLPLHLSHIGQGASCFLILSGPSLLDNDLAELGRRGIFTLGVNNAPTLVRCNAWGFVDTPAKFHDGIWRDPGCMKFVNRRYMQKHLRTRQPNGEFSNMLGTDGKPLYVKDLPGVVSVDRNADFNPARWLAEPSINWGHSKASFSRNRSKYSQILNVMFYAIKLAYALGFRVVYLVGCDFQMTPEQPYAFAQGKSKGAASNNNGSYYKLNQMLGELQPHFLAAGFHVFNTNKTSGLTVFPHIPYKQAIATAVQFCPQGVLDSAGWYDNIGGN